MEISKNDLEYIKTTIEWLRDNTELIDHNRTQQETIYNATQNSLDCLSRALENDSMSGKDLRVCEVIAIASFIVQNGVDAMYDELIDKHLEILRQQPFTSSVQYFVETGKVSGTFLLQLRKLLKEHDEICQAAK